MQVKHKLFNCVEIMLFNIPLICHMTWYTEKLYIVFLCSGYMTNAFPAATMICKVTFLIPKPPKILQIAFHKLEVV